MTKFNKMLVVLFLILLSGVSSAQTKVIPAPSFTLTSAKMTIVNADKSTVDFEMSENYEYAVPEGVCKYLTNKSSTEENIVIVKIECTINSFIFSSGSACSTLTKSGDSSASLASFTYNNVEYKMFTSCNVIKGVLN